MPNASPILTIEKWNLIFNYSLHHLPQCQKCRQSNIFVFRKKDFFFYIFFQASQSRHITTWNKKISRLGILAKTHGHTHTLLLSLQTCHKKQLETSNLQALPHTNTDKKIFLENKKKIIFF